MNEWRGINYPFKGGIQNVLSRQIGTKLIRNDVLQLIYTRPGERVYRPDYGIGIDLFLYDQLDDYSINELDTKIRDQMAIYEQRVSIDQLDLTQNKDKNRLDLLMVCSLIQSPDEIFEIRLNLPIFGEINNG